MVLIEKQLAAIEEMVKGWEPDEPESRMMMVGALVEAIETAEEE